MLMVMHVLLLFVLCDCMVAPMIGPFGWRENLGKVKGVEGKLKELKAVRSGVIVYD